MAILPRDASLMMRDFCALAPIMPVLVVDDASSARPLAEVLIGAGLPALEVTLRTPAALDATKEMATVPGGQVGVGTLITPDDVRAAKRAGAAFGVSPGATEELLAACEEEGLPLLPGAATASEAMSLLARGYDMLKFFPAEPSGGTRALKAFGGPLPQISFCPTGGISTGNAGEYLGLDNVLCVGGSWIAPRDLVARGGWDEIEKRAKAAAGLG
ncbi:bifunctional 4-hydroxy-2-oxoglutarate aldolase/2-dehydro-3-deoxy-phosphogluconate aldolase [Roseovarius sp. SYSU LYC5161]|uniref:bifunctional 4-hydroxy-2-oxoglutarate aldolase/2-dehydro-3-deoxy-phosphogluconate aldolase n=1 Tax=Roseovarius halophilus (ex Wu et al. 2025) TaxID=3376060 RepID=UPI00399A5B3A